MYRNLWIWAAMCVVLIGLSGCNRERSDWQKTRAANDTGSYAAFVKKYPHGSFTAQAQARLQELTEDSDWQKARDANTAASYQAFLLQHPQGKWSEEARIRIENFALAQSPAGSPPAAGTPAAGTPPAGTQPPAAPNQAASTAHAPRPHAKTSALRGGYAIQLGAFKSGAAAAYRRWRVLFAHDRAILHGLKPVVRATKTRAGRLYRLQVAGLSASRARSVCRRLKAHSQPCVVLAPVHRRAHR